MFTAIDHGSSRTVVTDQTGLGGGGQKPYTKSGEYRFASQDGMQLEHFGQANPKEHTAIGGDNTNIIDDHNSRMTG